MIDDRELVYATSVEIQIPKAAQNVVRTRTGVCMLYSLCNQLGISTHKTTVLAWRSSIVKLPDDSASRRILYLWLDRFAYIDGLFEAAAAIQSAGGYLHIFM